MTRVSLPALYELCEEFKRDGEDAAAIERFEAWAKGKAGVSVRRDGAALTITWHGRDLWSSSGEATGATLGQAMAAVEKGAGR